MTKVMMNINDKNDIYFDCDNHAGDHDTCTIVTTLCNVLVVATQRQNFLVDKYEKGHVRINITGAKESLVEQFLVVLRVLEQLEEDSPKYIKIY